MNARRLRRILQSDRHLSSRVVGIFAVDTLQKCKLGPGQGVIVNTDVWKGRGIHWVVLYRSAQGNYEFFDSFGRPPQYYDERFKTFLQRDLRDPIHNSMPLQDNDSDLCGAYVVYFLYFRSRGLTMKNIISHFSSNSRLNDKLVKAFVDECF